MEALAPVEAEDVRADLSGPVHISRLKLMAKSATHYAAGFAGRPTYAMEAGSAVHHLIFATSRVVSMAKGKQRRGKDYDAFLADNPGAVVLTYGEGIKALAMARSVGKNAEAMRVLDGTRETLREWSIDGRACAGTPDVVGHDYVTELKTSMTAHPDRFAWHSQRMGYHAQLAWYMDGVKQGGKQTPEAAYVVAVESSFPFVTSVFRLTDRAIDKGRRLYLTWWEQMQTCERSNEWPPYTQGVVALDVPDDDDLGLDFGDEESDEAAA